MGIRAFGIPTMGGAQSGKAETSIYFEGDAADLFIDMGVGAQVSGTFDGVVHELALEDEFSPRRARVNATVTPSGSRPGMNELIALQMRRTEPAV